MSLLPFGNPLQKTWYYIPPLPPPSPPFSRGGEEIVHPCAVPLRRPPRDLMPIFSKGFLNGKRDIGGGASPRWGLAPPEKKVYPGK